MAYGTINTDKLVGSSGGTLNPDSSVFRNRIINGAMVIDQRNAGAEVNPALNSTYYLDRWQANGTVASKFKIGQNAGSVTLPAGFTNYLGVTSLSAYTVGASEQFNVLTKIEGYNIADLAWGTANASPITLSFRVYSSLTGTFSGSITNSATNRCYVFNYTVSSANTWTTISVTIAGDTTGTWLTTNGIGMFVIFGLGSGSTYSGTAGSWGSTYYTQSTGSVSVVGTSGATFYITGVQLEKGSTATSFDYRPYGTELQLCQRYAQIFKGSDGVSNSYVRIGQGNAQSTTGGNALVTPPVRFRASPTVTTSGSFCVYDGAVVTSVSGGASIDAASAANSVLLGWANGTSLTLARTYQYLIQNDSTAYLLLSAEL